MHFFELKAWLKFKSGGHQPHCDWGQYSIVLHTMAVWRHLIIPPVFYLNPKNLCRRILYFLCESILSLIQLLNEFTLQCCFMSKLNNSIIFWRHGFKWKSFASFLSSLRSQTKQFLNITCGKISIYTKINNHKQKVINRKEQCDLKAIYHRPNK